jgi:hypothetical protein
MLNISTSIVMTAINVVWQPVPENIRFMKGTPMCKGKTKRALPCKNRTKDVSGYCHTHYKPQPRPISLNNKSGTDQQQQQNQQQQLQQQLQDQQQQLHQLYDNLHQLYDNLQAQQQEQQQLQQQLQDQQHQLRQFSAYQDKIDKQIMVILLPFIFALLSLFLPPSLVGMDGFVHKRKIRDDQLKNKPFGGIFDPLGLQKQSTLDTVQTRKVKTRKHVPKSVTLHSNATIALNTTANQTLSLPLDVGDNQTKNATQTRATADTVQTRADTTRATADTVHFSPSGVIQPNTQSTTLSPTSSSTASSIIETARWGTDDSSHDSVSVFTTLTDTDCKRLTWIQKMYKDSGGQLYQKLYDQLVKHFSNRFTSHQFELLIDALLAEKLSAETLKTLYIIRALFHDKQICNLKVEKLLEKLGNSKSAIKILYDDLDEDEDDCCSGIEDCNCPKQIPQLPSLDDDDEDKLCLNCKHLNHNHRI